MKDIKLNTFLYYFGLIYYLEIAFKFLVFDKVLSLNLMYIALFTIPIALLFTIITRLFTKKINKALTLIFTIILILIFAFQYVFVSMFSVPFSLNTLSIALQALEFTDIIFKSIITYFFGIVLFALGILFYIAFKKQIEYKPFKLSQSLLLIAIFAVTYIISLLSLIPFNDNIYSARKLYFKLDAPKQIINTFGVITYEKIDFKRYIFGFEKELLIEKKETEQEPKKEEKYNIQNIDFNLLIETEKDESIKQMHSYFLTEEATKQNEYTGMFEGKNLIFVIAEGFNQIAIQKDITPTLYKLSNEGFNFTNFYSPVFLSTTGGEFQATTGLIPSQEIIDMWKKSSPAFPYALGHTFSKLEYNVNAYHDWKYDFYKRNITMPTLGYNYYLGCGNGLEKMMNCNAWTPSDIDMVDATYNLYAGKVPFLTYYFTVSGHSNYNWEGQKIASKNKKYVDKLEYSESIKAYLATQIELDKALELLVKKLEEQDILDDTVIALVGDHYPYSLSTKLINEISDYERDELFEVNRSSFILWNSEMNPIEIDKVGGQIDVLPTLLNLFGIEYDSRLIVGKDLLSDSDGIVVFSNRNWITDVGRYNAENKKFASNNTKTNQKYIDSTNTKVANMFTMSHLIVEKDYYRSVVPK